MRNSNQPDQKKQDYTKSIELGLKCEKFLRQTLDVVSRLFLVLLMMLTTLIVIVGIRVFDAWATMYWPGYKEFFHNGGIHNEVYFCSEPVPNLGESSEAFFTCATAFKEEFEGEPGRRGANVPELCRAVGNLDARTSDENRFDRERFPARADN